MGNVAKVSLLWRHHGESLFDPSPNVETVTTFHVMSGESEPAIGEADREELIFHTLAWWETDNGGFVEAKSAWPGSLKLYAVECRTIEPTVSDPTITTLLEPSAGTSGTRNLYPPQCAFVLGLRTGMDTRRGRGRMFLPAWEPGDPNHRVTGWVTPENQTDLGHIGAHLAYEIRSVYAGVEDGPFVLAVYSRVNQDATPVTHFEIPSRIRTQRRRALVPTYSAHSLSTGEPA